jgi:hypothetical protein
MGFAASHPADFKVLNRPKVLIGRENERLLTLSTECL